MKSLLASYSRCCSGGGVLENRTTAGGLRTAAIIWRTAGFAAARITTARGDTTGTSCRECRQARTAEVCGTGEACASSPATSASTTAAPPPSAAPAPAPPQKPVEPPPPPPPVVKEFTVPAGTSLAVTVLSNLGSKTSQVEDVVKGPWRSRLVIDGTTAVSARR
jgi:hypothetical protein